MAGERSKKRLAGRLIGLGVSGSIAAMQAGTVFGYQGLVSGLLERLRQELAEMTDCDPAQVKAILTGGLAAAPWAADLPGISANDPNLTLTGLAILHAEVSGGERLPLGLR